MALEGQVPSDPELMRDVHDRPTREIEIRPLLGGAGLQGIADRADQPIPYFCGMGWGDGKVPLWRTRKQPWGEEERREPQAGDAQEGESYPTPYA